MGIGWTEVLLIILVILLLFGASRLPAALGGLGKGIREFRKALRGDDEHRAELEAVARELKAGVGKRVTFLPDGTVEVGLPDGATLVDVDEYWATVEDGSGSKRYPLLQVRRIVFKG